MARGSEAKILVINKLKETFGSDYIGENGGKHYIWAKDGAEKVQIAISLTCPKVQIETVDVNAAFGDGIDFEASPVIVQAKPAATEITQDEIDNLASLMASLGL